MLLITYRISHRMVCGMHGVGNSFSLLHLYDMLNLQNIPGGEICGLDNDVPVAAEPLGQPGQLPQYKIMYWGSSIVTAPVKFLVDVFIC